MSRSRRKSPALGVTSAASDREGKTVGNRRVRRATNVALKSGEEDMPDRDLLDNAYSHPKDGKVWHGKAMPEKLKRK